MSWRPEGWENTILDIQDRLVKDATLHAEDYIEAGADAMLEVLKELPSSVVLNIIFSGVE